MTISGSRRILTILHILYFIFILGWGIMLQYVPYHTTWSNYFFNAIYAVLYLTGAVVAFAGARFLTTQIVMGRALFYVGLGLLSYVIGLAIWTYYNLVLNVGVPSASPADLFFILFYPLMAIGCWHFLTMVSGRIEIGHIIESLGIFGLAALVIVGYLNRPDLSEGLSAIAKTINILYPVGDSLLVALAYLSVRASRGNFQFGILLFILGFFVQVAADLLFFYLTGNNTYWNGDISDILFAVSGFILSLATITLFYDFAMPSESTT